MSKPKRRQGSVFYYAQRAVPKDLKGVLGNGPLWKSLRTVDPEAAKPLCRRQHDTWDELFRHEREKLKAASPPPPAQQSAKWLAMSPEDRKARELAREEYELEQLEYQLANTMSAVAHPTGASWLHTISGALSRQDAQRRS